ncbi:MAG: hypothetical protein EXS68_01800 [Candidatus Ryanbacteria bacterium]|nr:hypothetical protein [Candidatus Ryanbacteria bacterium]
MKRYLIMAVIMFPVAVLLVNGFEKIISNTNPLVAGEKPPPEFTQLIVSEGLAGTQLHGTYRKEGHEVRFFTIRGPTLSVLERSANIPKFEMSMCFVNEQGYPLFTVAGGDGVPIPECNKAGGEFDSDKTTEQEAELAREAMQAIARLSFRHEYEPEKYILVGSLAIANTLDHVLADGIQLP